MDCRYEVGTLFCSGRWQAIMAIYVVQATSHRLLCKRAKNDGRLGELREQKMNERCAVLPCFI